MGCFCPRLHRQHHLQLRQRQPPPHSTLSQCRHIQPESRRVRRDLSDEPSRTIAGHHLLGALHPTKRRTQIHLHRQNRLSRTGDRNHQLCPYEEIVRARKVLYRIKTFYLYQIQTNSKSTRPAMLSMVKRVLFLISSTSYTACTFYLFGTNFEPIPTLVVIA